MMLDINGRLVANIDHAMIGLDQLEEEPGRQALELHKV